MAKVITFSRHFQKGHPRAGEPTYFVEQILTNLIQQKLPQYGTELLKQEIVDIKSLDPEKSKGHTIRSGKRWKVGDKFSPRVWSGKPYCSRMIQFAPDIEIKKIWDIEIDWFGVVSIGNRHHFENEDCEIISKNDGLNVSDFFDWIIAPIMKSRKPFSGQVICWDEKINY